MAKNTEGRVAFLKGREGPARGRVKDVPGRQMVMFSPGGESTDLALMVDALAHEETQAWHPSRIRDALVKEAGVEPGLAGEIASEVESDLLRWAGTGSPRPSSGSSSTSSSSSGAWTPSSRTTAGSAFRSTTWRP